MKNQRSTWKNGRYGLTRLLRYPLLIQIYWGVLISKKFSFQEIANLHTVCIEQLNKEYLEQNIKELTDLIDLIFDMIIQNKENTERKEK